MLRVAATMSVNSGCMVNLCSDVKWEDVIWYVGFEGEVSRRVGAWKTEWIMWCTCMAESHSWNKFITAAKLYI